MEPFLLPWEKSKWQKILTCKCEKLFFICKYKFNRNCFKDLQLMDQAVLKLQSVDWLWLNLPHKNFTFGTVKKLYGNGYILPFCHNRRNGFSSNTCQIQFVFPSAIHYVERLHRNFYIFFMEVINWKENKEVGTTCFEVRIPMKKPKIFMEFFYVSFRK